MAAGHEERDEPPSDGARRSCYQNLHNLLLCSFIACMNYDEIESVPVTGRLVI
jgi:hypothetical protein